MTRVTDEDADKNVEFVGQLDLAAEMSGVETVEVEVEVAVSAVVTVEIAGDTAALCVGANGLGSAHEQENAEDAVKDQVSELHLLVHAQMKEPLCPFYLSWHHSLSLYLYHYEIV